MSDNHEHDDELMDWEDDPVVVMTDEEGNEYYYREEIVIPVGDKRFAVLVPLDDDCCEDEECECGCHDEEVDVFIARIDADESGEDVYSDPTDEEFEEVSRLYQELMDEEEEE